MMDKVAVALLAYRNRQYLSVYVLDVPKRCRWIFERASVTCLGGLAGFTENDLLAVKGCGKITVREIKEALADYGLSLRTDE